MVTADLNDPLVRDWIVILDGFALEYVRTHPVHAQPQSHLTDRRERNEAIDVCIGEPSTIGGGCGHALLNQFACMLMPERVACIPGLERLPEMAFLDVP
uniref:Putative aminoglycoside 6'-N-acetyltransferase n=1 Tax=Ensifer adhaerens TaxID=106592 RepID=D1CTA4_ENSAD|nr:putative aminoglycoside 6'-N-acetyltransferase [Ensifer adhaerens]